MQVHLAIFSKKIISIIFKTIMHQYSINNKLKRCNFNLIMIVNITRKFQHFNVQKEITGTYKYKLELI